MSNRTEVTPAASLKSALASHTRTARARREGAVAAEGWQSGRNDPLPALQLDCRSLDMLRVAKRPVRRSDAGHIAEVARSIATFGFTVPILIERDGTIIDGHIRYQAARSLELEAVPCIVVDHLSDTEIAALKVAVNRMAEKGSWDLEILREELIDLGEAEIDLTLTGFSAPEIDIIITLDGDDKQTDEPEDAEAVSDAPPVSRRGDLWLLGPHRLLCGDSTNPDSYSQLMGGKAADCIFTDPPYNIPIAGFVSPKGKHADFAMGVGEMSDDDFRRFLASVLGKAAEVLVPGGVTFACMDWRNIHLLMLAGADVGLTHINTAIWNKGSGGMGGLYRSAHELIAVFAKGPSPATNNVQLGKHGRDRTNVWTYPGANRRGSTAAALLGDHPTPKPVELVRDALLDVTKRGDIVLDPFMGSGTTIMAAHTCGRIGYGIELDPAYADLIVRRWKVGGGPAILDDSSETYDQVAERRRNQPRN